MPETIGTPAVTPEGSPIGPMAHCCGEDVSCSYAGEHEMVFGSFIWHLNLAMG